MLYFHPPKQYALLLKSSKNIIRKLSDSISIHLLFESDADIPLINLYRSQKNILIRLMDGIQHLMALVMAAIIQTILQNCFF